MLRPNWRAALGFLGSIVKWMSVPVAVPLLVAAWYGEPLVPFAVTVAVTLTVGVSLERWRGVGEFGGREAYLMVALAWLVVSLVGTIPFLVAGNGVLAHPVPALFESMSGITTTGATVIQNFGAHSRAMLLWRQILQWIGGLGVLVLAISVLSQLSVGGANLMETETQTQNVQKLTPGIEGTARLLWKLYTAITVLCVASLYALYHAGVAPKMTLYNAVAHALTGVATAGFSPMPESLGAFSAAAQWTIVPFMAVGATNFILIYHVAKGDLRRPLESDEFRFYVGIIVAASTLLAALLLSDPEAPVPLASVARHAVFQVVSILTTTGFATVDYNAWSPAAKHLLFLLMFLGGMAGSTTCSIKLVRWLVIVKALRRDLFLAVHPSAIRPIRLSGDPVDDETVRDIYGFTLISLVIFGLGTTFVAVDAAQRGAEVTEFEAMGAAAATFFNIGPAFGIAGPFDSYQPFSRPTKLVMVALMWVGRIEIIPVLVLFTRSYWTS